MASSGAPLVSVVTPVYNGEEYLAEAIESVLAQTYERWEYLIVDNRSEDRTGEIAEEFAVRDSRIRVDRSDRFRELIPNWNHALGLISPASSYCKVLHADDWLFPECLARMVELAEAHPSVGIVSAYNLRGTGVWLDGLPPDVTVVPGREACRRMLLEERNLFGSPTALLFRSRIIRERSPFYDETELHADVKVCFDVLRRWDLGFVHQVLTFTRVHQESITRSHARRLHTFKVTRLRLLEDYGEVYLRPDELKARRERILRDYYRFLARSLAARRRDGRFWKVHREGLDRIGLPIDRLRLAKATLKLVVERLLNPLATLRGKRRARDASS